MSYSQTDKIISPAAGVSDYFGTSAVIDGYHAAIGAPGANKTYIYRKDLEGNWENMIELAIDGDSVAMDGVYLLVGDKTANVARVYNKDTTGNSLQTFTGTAGTEFGGSVAISKDYIVVGASIADTNQGVIYIYEKTGTNIWTAYSGNPMLLDIRTIDDYFGCAVATNNDSILVGTKGDNQRTGAVYIYKKNDDIDAWEQTQKIIALDGVYSDEFGASISVSGNYFIAGASLHESDTGESNAGAAYIYKYGTSWYQIDKLIGIDESNYEKNQFGKSVYIDRDYIIVGSPMARDKGVIDIFYKKRSWGHFAKIIGDDSAEDDEFGNAVSISDRFAIIGSFKNDTAAINSGAIYLYDNPPIKLRLAQQFEVNGEYVPSKASVYLKRAGKNKSNYWELYDDEKNVIDTTNFSSIDWADNKVIFDDRKGNFTGNGYMVLAPEAYCTIVGGSDSSFSTINYLIKAIKPAYFNIWLRCVGGDIDEYIVGDFITDILLDGIVIKSIDEIISGEEWTWLSSTIMIPDIIEHTLGLRLKVKNCAVDKIYLDADRTIIPYYEGPSYSDNPYFTVHLKVYSSYDCYYPMYPLLVYDYKTSIDEIVQDDWYNFNISILDSRIEPSSNSILIYNYSSFSNNYFLVLSSTGSTSSNFVIWEINDNDEYRAELSAIKI